MHPQILYRTFRAFSSFSTSSFPSSPISAKNANGLATSYDIFSRLLQDRIIYLSGAIDDVTTTSITAQLLYLEAVNPHKDIFMYINSPGGSVTAGLAIYDTMQYVGNEISTVCLGQACSMASLLLASGAPGKRMILPNGSVMVHQPSGGYQGQATDIEIHAKHIVDTKHRLNKIYQRHMKPGTTIEAVHELLERDRFLTAEEAVEFGIVDRVVEPRKKEREVEKRDE